MPALRPLEAAFYRQNALFRGLRHACGELEPKWLIGSTASNTFHLRQTGHPGMAAGDIVERNCCPSLNRHAGGIEAKDVIALGCV
jgi:hypothetical protein